MRGPHVAVFLSQWQRGRKQYVLPKRGYPPTRLPGVILHKVTMKILCPCFSVIFFYVLFDPEDRGNIFFRNVCELVPDYVALLPKSSTLSLLLPLDFTASYKVF